MAKQLARLSSIRVFKQRSVHLFSTVFMSSCCDARNPLPSQQKLAVAFSLFDMQQRMDTFDSAVKVKARRRFALLLLDSLSVPSWPLKMGPIGCSETSVTNHQSTLRTIPKERRHYVPSRKSDDIMYTAVGA